MIQLQWDVLKYLKCHKQLKIESKTNNFGNHALAGNTWEKDETQNNPVLRTYLQCAHKLLHHQVVKLQVLLLHASKDHGIEMKPPR